MNFAPCQRPRQPCRPEIQPEHRTRPCLDPNRVEPRPDDHRRLTSTPAEVRPLAPAAVAQVAGLGRRRRRGGGAASSYSKWVKSGPRGPARPAPTKARPEPLQLTITERGTLESAENSDIVCRVKARSQGSTIATTIRWVIDDGTQVRRGRQLVQLDDSGLHEQLKTQNIASNQARADWIQADKNYEIVGSQNNSDIATARDCAALISRTSTWRSTSAEGRTYVAEPSRQSIRGPAN